MRSSMMSANSPSSQVSSVAETTVNGGSRNIGVCPVVAFFFHGPFHGPSHWINVPSGRYRHGFTLCGMMLAQVVLELVTGQHGRLHVMRIAEQQQRKRLRRQVLLRA